MKALAKTLAEVEPFCDFSEPQRKALAKMMSVADHDDGTVFIQQGHPGKACYLLLEGHVDVVQEPLPGADGTKTPPDGAPSPAPRVHLKRLGPGEVFGVLSLLGKLPAAATCTAVGAVRAASLPQVDYRLMFKVDAPLAYAFQWLVAEQLARDLMDRNQALREQLERL